MEKRRHRFSHGDRGEQGFRFRHDQARTLMEACGEEEGNFRLHLHIPPEHEGRADRAIEGRRWGDATCAETDSFLEAFYPVGCRTGKGR